MSGATLPSFGKIRAALRKTTEHLARELHAPTAKAPAWNDFEWSIARAVAAMQGTSTLLAKRLLWHGPGGWHEFLHEQLELGLARDLRISALLAAVDTTLREAGIGCVALKGAALRSQGIYSPGERPMGDIDLLARADDLARVDDCLRALDYLPAYVTRRHHVYEPSRKTPGVAFGEHPDNPLKIEVHTHIADALPARPVDITAGLWRESVRPGLNPYRDAAALMKHLLLHAAGNMRAHGLRQVQLHDIALFARNLDAHHWAALLENWWVLPPLDLTERYYPGCIPAQVLVVARKRCTPLLRLAAARNTLSEVSWSNLRIAAFPGIAWSRTPLEALRFVRSRVIPGQLAIDELQNVQAAQPALRQFPWYGLSHTSRILRWLFSTPPRVQTMVSVCAALGRESQ